MSSHRIGPFVLLSLLLSPQACITADESVVERVVAAWSAREARYQTGHVEFEHEEIHQLYSPQKHKQEGSAFDGSVTLKHRIVFDAGRARFTRSGLEHDAESNRWIEKDYTATYDGSHSYELYQYSLVAEHPPGFVKDTASILGDGWDYHSTPVFMAFRPLTRSLQGHDPRAWGPPVRRSRINGRDALVFAHGKYEFSLDPNREYVLLRQELFTGDAARRKTWFRLDVEYRDDAEWGYVPDRWTIIEAAPGTGQVLKTIPGRITSMEFNQPVSDEDFVIDFPPGAVVADGPSQMRYVVREDGSRRKIDRSEARAGMTYDEMLKTEAPSVVAARESRTRMLLVVAILAVAGSLGYALYRRWQTT